MTTKTTKTPETTTAQPRLFTMGRLRTALITVAAVAVVVFIGFLPQDKGTPPPLEAPTVNVEVEIVRPEDSFADTFNLPAVVEPNRVVNVSAEVAGRIESINGQEGGTCQAGDVIVSLNTDLLKAEYDRSVAQTAFDQKEYERTEGLYKQNVASAQKLDEEAAKLAVSKAVVEAARAQLERANIVCPINGILNRLLVEEGEYLQPGNFVAEIVDVETVKVVTFVPERDIRFFRTGADALVLLGPNSQEQHLSGTITYIGELADEKTRATRLEITLNNRARALRGGQIVRVRLIRRILPDVILIPLLAVIPLENGYAVYVVEDDAAQRREVTVGLLKGRHVQILSGLAPGDRLIVAGHRLVGPGQRVVVTTER